MIPWASWHDEADGPGLSTTQQQPGIPLHLRPGQNPCFTLLISSAEATATSPGEVLHANYMYETKPLCLANGEQVWLCAELLETTQEQARYVDSVLGESPRDSRGRSPPTEKKAYAHDIHRGLELSLIIDFPLGRKHFGMS